MTRADIDAALFSLGGRGAKYQTLQVILISMGSLGAAFQLMNNVFIGRAVEGVQCATGSEGEGEGGPFTHTANHTSWNSSDAGQFSWNSSHVVVGQCEVTFLSSNVSEVGRQLPCPRGYRYTYPRQLSFRTEFDLVCGRRLLGSLVQTLLIAGQGVGAVLFSAISDRYGRKPVLIGCQFALFALGVGIGLSPSYPALAALKFLIGAFQQGVVTGMSTMGIELFRSDFRCLQVVAASLSFGLSTSLMALVAYLMRELTWRYLQHALSAVSLITCLVQLWYVDESLRWLVANGRRAAALRVLRRAAAVNRKDFSDVTRALYPDTEMKEPDLGHDVTTCDVTLTDGQTDRVTDGQTVKQTGDVADRLTDTQTDKLSILVLFRHKRLLSYAAIMWLSWFTCAFSYFSVILMSTSLFGNRFLNYFLASLTDIPAGLVLYFMLSRAGRKNTSYVFLALTAVALISCGVFRMFTGSAVLGVLSVVSNTLGSLGATSIFIIVFFYTPELFPTNFRNQALGLSSFAGRLGGMMGPFMTDLAEVAVWAPGVLVGGLCVVVISLFRFLPETKGRLLPHTIQDIEAWTSSDRNPSEKDKH